jgi:hypothetical protein
LGSSQKPGAADSSSSFAMLSRFPGMSKITSQGVHTLLYSLKFFQRHSEKCLYPNELGVQRKAFYPKEKSLKLA